MCLLPLTRRKAPFSRGVSISSTAVIFFLLSIRAGKSPEIFPAAFPQASSFAASEETPGSPAADFFMSDSLPRFRPAGQAVKKTGVNYRFLQKIHAENQVKHGNGKTGVKVTNPSFLTFRKQAGMPAMARPFRVEFPDAA